MKRKGRPPQRGRGGGRGSRGRFNGASKRGRHHLTTVSEPPEPEKERAIDEDASDEDHELVMEEPDNAYSALLQTLQETSGTFARAYAQRRREEQGGGTSSSEEEAAGGDLEADSNPDTDSESQSEIDAESEGGHGDNEELSVADKGADAMTNGKWGGGSGEKEESDGDDEDGLSEAENDEEGDLERLASGASAGTCIDPFKTQIEHELNEAEIAKLVEGEGKAKFKAKVAAAGFPEGKWITNVLACPKVEKSLDMCAVKVRLQKHWQGLPGHMQWGDFESEQQAQFFSFCNSYKDILHSRRHGSQSRLDSDQQHQTTMDAYVLHVLNHVFKTRDHVTHNNEKLHRHQSTGVGAVTDVTDPPRDQGFTRPKVLILLPLRSTALKFVERLIKLAPTFQTGDVEHKGRFFDDFGVEEDEEDADEGGNEPAGAGTAGKEQGKRNRLTGKPADFLALFSGNNDDHFRIGIKFTRKSIKLYSDFYSSDLIIASPIGLVTRIGEAESAKKEEKQDIDFLSSIEIVVLDYADVILMQNWSHVVSVFDHLNRLPTQQHGTDFMRIREWYLNGHARHYRQTIVLSAFPDAGVNALFYRSCPNHAGKIKLQCDSTGVLSKVVLQVRQVYERFDCQSITDVDDARFNVFVKQVFPRIKNSLQGGVMLFTRSYFDFVRLRNFLKSENASFCLLGEYTKQSDISRGRSWFYHGKRRIMVYTERSHFYHRYKIRGIRDLIFYSLPYHAHFYSEISNLLEGVENPSCTVLFSKFDNLQLERIVGSSRAQRMLSSTNRTFMFC